MNEFQKSLTRFMYIALVVVATAIGVFAVTRHSGGKAAQASAFDMYGRNGRGVTTTGTCVVRTKPDVAEVTIGINQNSRTAGSAKSNVKSRTKRVIQSLRASGIETKDIQTERYSLQPEWKGQYNLMSWTVEEALRVKIRKTDTVADVLDAAVKAGANRVGRLSYSVNDLDALRAKGRKQASKVAREKAEQLASSLGGKLGALVTCSENYPGENRGYWNGGSYGSIWYDGHPYDGGMQRYAQRTINDEPPMGDSTDRQEITIQPGQMVINVVVSATYDVE